MTEVAAPDIAALAAGLGTALHAAGLPVGPDRCERLARAAAVMDIRTVAELRVCALATLVSDPSQMTTFERVFALLFGGPDPLKDLPLPTMADSRPEESTSPPPGAQIQSDRDGWLSEMRVIDTGAAAPPDNAPLSDAPAVHRVASAAERLRGRDFAELSVAELRELVALMREMSLAVPPRRTRRYRRARDGKRPDLRGTLRQARRSGGEPIRLSRRAPRVRPRRLVVLCDISGSMESYARALLMLMYCLHGGQVSRGQSRPEVFSFATRLTRLTPALAASSPDTMLAKAGEAAPDWSGGTRIGAAVKEFNDRYGARGLARGAVVLIISDGWETGEPALLGEQMARLSRIAHRIVWANPRTQSPRYRPEVGGMAAAWPYCDAVVSAHSLDALGDLLAALRAR
ncbi:MAG TPA: VWA domain-containing protein [Streptosporangiaceae bacterium]|nr:VWA domain-containing protein [Streptosporangiaceae bacterium]